MRFYLINLIKFLWQNPQCKCYLRVPFTAPYNFFFFLGVIKIFYIPIVFYFINPNQKFMLEPPLSVLITGPLHCTL